ncbi:MAG: energy-coupling factor transporter transmembrane component T family protein [Bryobacteraceae bacterium]
MHHVVVDRWSRGVSPLHGRDARAKLAALLVFLISLATTPPTDQLAFAGYAALLILAAAVARLPIPALSARAALVLPFSATFALLTWWSGDPMRAVGLAEKSFLSGLAALLLVATTPLTRWTAALSAFRLPRTLILVIQFLYRYLFVVADQAQRMHRAAQCRHGLGKRPGRFQAAAGAVSVLFARSWQRADGVYHSMLARGFRGRFVPSSATPFRAADAIFLAAAAAACLVFRLAL